MTGIFFSFTNRSTDRIDVEITAATIFLVTRGSTANRWPEDVAGATGATRSEMAVDADSNGNPTFRDTVILSLEPYVKPASREAQRLVLLVFYSAGFSSRISSAVEWPP
jgi:hypothetical protein